jgi:hypothetical protein
MRQGLGLPLRPVVIAPQKTIIAAEDDDNRQNTKFASSFGADHAPKKQNGGIPSTRNAAVGKMQI